MNTDIVIYLTALFFLFFGWLTAAVIYGRRYHNHIKQCNKHALDAYNSGVQDGRSDILQDPEAIKKAYTYFFLTN